MLGEKYGSVKNIDVREAEDFIRNNNPLILDVRSPEEYGTGHLRNSRNTPLPGMDNFALDLKEYREKPVLVYCHAGMRSARAAQILIQQGYQKVYNLTQGVALWAAMGFELVNQE